MPTRTRRTQRNRTYDDATLRQIEEMVEEGLTARQIGLELGLGRRLVGALISRHGFRGEPKPYRLPQFSGWDFSSMNLNLGAHQ